MKKILICNNNILAKLNLKGQLHGRAEIFKGLKMTSRMKILRKKLYHVNQRQKHYKLCFDNFSLWRLNFNNTPHAQDNLSKLLTALSAIAPPSDGTLQNLCTFLVRVPALLLTRAR